MTAAPKSANPWPTPPPDLQEAIRRRADEIYRRNGKIPGRDLENWAQAEAEILRDFIAAPARKTAIVVNVDGVQYVGEYSPESALGYVPGEFPQGAPISVRFDGDRMYIRRPNGVELETTIVKKAE